MSAAGRVAGVGFAALIVGFIALSRNDRSPSPTAEHPSQGLTAEEKAFGPGTYVYPSADPDEVPVFRQPPTGPMMKVWDNDPRIIARSIFLLQTLYRSCPATKMAWPIIDIVSLQPRLAIFNGPAGKKYGWSDTLVIEFDFSTENRRLDVLPHQLTTVWPLYQTALFRLGDGHHPGIAPESPPAQVLCGQPPSAEPSLVAVPGLKVSPWPD